jgi:hypothetical protein
MNDYLRCTDCGCETDVTAESLYESMAKTKRGTWRKRSGWMKVLATLVSEWRCNHCLTSAEQEYEAARVSPRRP